MAFLFLTPSDLALPFQLDGLGIAHPQEPIHRPQGYPHHQWILVRSGTLEASLGSETALARPGDGLYLRPHEAHRYRGQGTEPAVVDWLCWHGDGVGPVLGEGPLNASGVYRLADTSAVDRVLGRTWSLAATAPATVLSACVYELLMALTDAAAVPGAPSRGAGWGRLGPVLARMREQSDQPWTVGALADLVDLSPQHLGRLFRQTLGVSPLRHLNRLRLARAQQLLVERPNLRVHEVARAVGWDDVNYFVRTFRRHLGQTPGQFRQLHR